MGEVRLPFTSTGRKYGYVTWSKAHDAQMRALLGERDRITVQVGEKSGAEKYIDWKHRRISVGYSTTRALPDGIREVRLRVDGRSLRVVFD